MQTYVDLCVWHYDQAFLTISFVEGVYRICIQKIKRDCLQEDIQTLAETDMPQSCGDNAVLKCVLVGTQS